MAKKAGLDTKKIHQVKQKAKEFGLTDVVEADKSTALKVIDTFGGTEFLDKALEKYNSNFVAKIGINSILRLVGKEPKDALAMVEELRGSTSTSNNTPSTSNKSIKTSFEDRLSKLK